MPIGVWQLTKEPALQAWGTDAHYAVIVSGSTTMTDLLDTYSDFSANVISGPIDVPSEAVGTSGAEYRYNHGDLNFGTGLSLTTARWCVILKGNYASTNATDPVVAWVDLNTAGSNVSATSLIVRADATRGIGGLSQTN